MLGAIKSWAMKQSISPPKRQRHPIDLLRAQSVLTSQLPSSCNHGDDQNVSPFLIIGFNILVSDSYSYSKPNFTIHFCDFLRLMVEN